MNNLNNINKKKNWNQKFLTNMKYQSFKRRNYYIGTLNANSKELYIIAYDYDKNEGFFPNDMPLIGNIAKKAAKKEEAIENFYKENCVFDSTQTIDSKGWSVFDSLIHLRQKLEYSYNISEDTISEKELSQLESNLSAKDKKEIIYWCKKYGMPFIGNKLENPRITIGRDSFLYGFKNDFETCFFNDICCCRLSTFLITLNILFKTLFFYLVYLTKKHSLNNIDISELYDTEYNYHDIKSYIKKAFYSISDKSIINFDDIFEENGLPEFENYAETMFSLAMYQLAVIVSSKKIYDISKCKACKGLYIPTRKSREYCMSCDRHTKIKEEDLENGKHKSKKE